MLHRYPRFWKNILAAVKYNLVLQRYQIWPLKSLPFSPKSTSILLQAWWRHMLVPHLLSWPTSSGKATLLDFALYLWRLGRKPSGRPPAFTSTWPRLAFLPAMGARNQGHRSWDEENFHQRTSARGNGGMCGVTLPPCGELPLEMNEERWLTNKLWAIMCSKNISQLLHAHHWLRTCALVVTEWDTTHCCYFSSKGWSMGAPCKAWRSYAWATSTYCFSAWICRLDIKVL